MKAKSQFHSDFFFVIYIVVDTIELQTVVVFVDYFFCFPVLLFFFYCSLVRCRSYLFRTVRSTFFFGKKEEDAKSVR